ERGGAAGVLCAAARSRPYAQLRAACQGGGQFPPLRRRLRDPRAPGRAGTAAAVNDPAPRGIKPALESPGESYAGRTRHTQLEYEALLANVSIGIAFTRERRVFLCNQRFAEMLGWGPDELIGQPGEVMYPSRESYHALGQIAVPILSAGRQLDLEWELRRKDGSTFVCRMIAKALDAGNTQRGTVWIVEDITDKRRHAASSCGAARTAAASGRAPTGARSTPRTRTAARCGSSRTSPSSGAPRTSCSGCSPSSRRCSTTWWSASRSPAIARLCAATAASKSCLASPPAPRSAALRANCTSPR